MGKVDCFYIEGIYCWFYSQEHEPIHIHAKRRGEWEVKVKFLEPKTRMIEWKRGPKRMSKKHRKILYETTEQYREILLKEWEKKVICDA